MAKTASSGSNPDLSAIFVRTQCFSSALLTLTPVLPFGLSRPLSLPRRMAFAGSRFGRLKRPVRRWPAKERLPASRDSGAAARPRRGARRTDYAARLALPRRPVAGHVQPVPRREQVGDCASGRHVSRIIHSTCRHMPLLDILNIVSNARHIEPFHQPEADHQVHCKALSQNKLGVPLVGPFPAWHSLYPRHGGQEACVQSSGANPVRNGAACGDTSAQSHGWHPGLNTWGGGGLCRNLRG